MFFLKKYPFRLTLSYFFYRVKFLLLFLKREEELISLKKNGFIHFKKVISKDIVHLAQKYLDYTNYEFVSDRKKISNEDLSKIYKELDSKKILKIIKKYLGKNLFCYDNSILTLGNLKSRDSAWQPHHDFKGNRLKIYIWLNKFSKATHPLFYMRGSNNYLMHLKKKFDNKFPELSNNKMDEIFGDVGDIIIFDTNGIHSNFKETTYPRSVIEITIENSGFFSRFNFKSTSGKNEISRLSALPLKTFLN